MLQPENNASICAGGTSSSVRLLKKSMCPLTRAMSSILYHCKGEQSDKNNHTLLDERELKGPSIGNTTLTISGTEVKVFSAIKGGGGSCKW